MDLDEWEFIPHDGSLGTHHDDDGGEKIFSRKCGKEETNSDFNMNRFTNPSPKKFPKFVESTEESRLLPNHLVPAPIQIHPNLEKTPDQELVKEIESPNTESDQEMVSKAFFKEEMEEEEEEEEKEKVSWGESNGNLKMWKWSLSGIGAVCSFGVAAATVCIIIFGNGQTRKQNHHKLRFQIYADDKRIKQVVLNEAISAVRVGVPFTRAQITFGGHYDAR